MKVQECIDQIRFDTSTLDDLSGKSINTLFNNNNIVLKLRYALDKYAKETRAIEGIYTFRLPTSTMEIDAPADALRSMCYRYCEVYIQGIKYMVDITELNQSENNFIYQWKGIPRWLVPWQNKLRVYPTSVTAGYSTYLSKQINKTETEIEVDDASGFLLNNGYFQIGGEKIQYIYRDSTKLYGCTRGVQNTMAASHLKDSDVLETNLWIFYFKRHFNIPVTNNVIPNEILDREMEVPDEHMEAITAYTAGSLLAKVDPARMVVYEKRFIEQLEKIKAEVFRGRKMTNNGGAIRAPFWAETQNSGIYFV